MHKSALILFLTVVVSVCLVGCNRDSTAEVCEKLSDWGADKYLTESEIAVFWGDVRRAINNARSEVATPTAGFLNDKYALDAVDFNQRLENFISLCSG